MSRLHQLLAVEPDLEGKYKRICEESKKTFGKAAMFTGFHRKLVSFSDDAPEFPEENSAMETTVHERLDYTAGPIAAYFDALLQKECTNQNASANLVVDGIPLATAVPATFLLGLEKRLKAVRAVYETIPTLQAGFEWKPSVDKGTGVWDLVHPEEKLKTEMQFKSQVLYEATANHPAQIEKWQEQTPVGKFVKNIWCGMITSHEKSALLERIDKLIVATKKARQKANSENVVKTSIGQNLINFINGNSAIAPPEISPPESSPPEI